MEFVAYFPVLPAERKWGAVCSGFGKCDIAPHRDYPLAIHPREHHFTWKRGRILSDYQLIYIPLGSGFFESAFQPKLKIQAGTLLILYPGVWHRYSPLPSTGWTEWWIEVNGSIFHQLEKNRILDKRSAVYGPERQADVEQLWSSALQLAHEKPAGYSLRLGSVAYDILIELHAPRFAGATRKSSVISEAETFLMENIISAPTVRETAAKFGMGYSHFRKMFRSQTGLSPKQYILQVRHRRVKDVLRNTTLSMKEISERFNYSSAYHFSREFSQLTGVSPTHWRKMNTRGIKTAGFSLMQTTLAMAVATFIFVVLIGLLPAGGNGFMKPKTLVTQETGRTMGSR